MTRTNRALLTVLLSLLLVLAVIGGVILGRSGAVGNGGVLAEPDLFSQTRYEADITSDKKSGSKKVKVVARFYDDGTFGTLNSVDTGCYSEIRHKRGYTYAVKTIRGDCQTGGRITFKPAPGQKEPLDVIMHYPDEPAQAPAPAAPTPWGTTDNEPDPKMPIGDDTGKEKVSFPDGSDHSRGKTEVPDNPVAQPSEETSTSAPEPSDAASEPAETPTPTVTDPSELPDATLAQVEALDGDRAVIRMLPDRSLGTISFLDNECYGVLTRNEEGLYDEHYFVGKCESIGVWNIDMDDEGNGTATLLANENHDIALLELELESLKWEMTRGEKQIARSGPAAPEFPAAASTDKSDDGGPIDPRDGEMRESGAMTETGYGPYDFGMGIDDAIAAGVDQDSIEEPMAIGRETGRCSVATDDSGSDELQLYFQDDKLAAISKKGGRIYFSGNVIDAFEPGDDHDTYIPGAEPVLHQEGETGIFEWNAENYREVKLNVRVIAETSETVFTMADRGTDCFDFDAPLSAPSEEQPEPEESEEEKAPSAAPQAAPAKGDCSPSAFDDPSNPAPLGITVNYCDGHWARAGMSNSGAVGIFQFADGEWVLVEADGRIQGGAFPCFDFDRLRSQGAPQAFLDQLTECS